jgi:hypothetical protein
MSFTSVLGIADSTIGHIVLGGGISMPTKSVGFGHDVPIAKFRLLSSSPYPLLRVVPSAPLPPSRTPGFIFFSPAMHPNIGAQVDVSEMSIVSRASDTYRHPSEKSCVRPFILGPAPSIPSGRAWPPDFSASYEPVLNSSQYGLMSNNPSSSALGDFSVRGELVDTMTMEVTIVLV